MNSLKIININSPSSWINQGVKQSSTTPDGQSFTCLERDPEAFMVRKSGRSKKCFALFQDCGRCFLSQSSLGVCISRETFPPRYCSTLETHQHWKFWKLCPYLEIMPIFGNYLPIFGNYLPIFGNFGNFAHWKFCPLEILPIK